MAAGVQIYLHAPFSHGPKRLRAPRTARLTVTSRCHAEDALHVVETRPLAAIEFRNPFIPAEVRQVHGRSGLNAMPVGVIADFMLLERFNHIRAAATLQSASFLAHDFESRFDVLLGQKFRHAQGRVVTGR